MTGIPVPFISVFGFASPASAIAGPYYIVAAQSHRAGPTEAESHLAGATEIDSHRAGPVAAEVS